MPVGAVAEEAEPERPHQREDVHQEQQRQRRRHQQPAGVPAPGVGDGGERDQRRRRERHPERRPPAAASARRAAITTTASTRARRQLVRFGPEQPGAAGAGRRRRIMRLVRLDSGEKRRGPAPASPGPRRGEAYLIRPASAQQVLLEGRDVVHRRLRVLLAGDRLDVLLLRLDQELEEVRHVPDVLLPVEARRPGPVPGPEAST